MNELITVDYFFQNLYSARFKLDKTIRRNLSLRELDDLVIRLERFFDQDEEMIFDILRKYNIPSTDLRYVRYEVVESVRYFLLLFIGYGDEWLRPTYDEYVQSATGAESYYTISDKLCQTDHFMILYYKRYFENWLPKFFPVLSDDEREEHISRLFSELEVAVVHGYELYLQDILSDWIVSLY